MNTEPSKFPAAKDAPRPFGVPSAISPVADVQGVSPGGVTYQNNNIVGSAGNPASNDARAKAIAKRLQGSINRSKNDGSSNAG